MLPIIVFTQCELICINKAIRDRKDLILVVRGDALVHTEAAAVQ